MAMPAANPEWGFFGHRRINRLAVFTLDQEMMPFFRANIEWLTDHAVDPDKRRYASKFEAIRHYIDLDHWGESETFAFVPRRFTDAMLWKANLVFISNATDTVIWKVDTITQADPEYLFSADSRVLMSSSSGQQLELQLGSYREFWRNYVWPQFYEDDIRLTTERLSSIGFPVPAAANTKVIVEDVFSSYGILPYHLEQMHRRITDAFIAEDSDRILRFCAEMGHYVGDAHVPLHTTENYNGQMTGQTGIHGFWESRLPELFADETYDYFVGKAEYIENPREYYWDIVLKSHSLVDSVLLTEKRLRKTFPADQQMVFDERSGRTIKTQSAEFAAAWDEAMQGMVEERFQAAIRSIGSVWYSCWVDAGQPDLNKLSPSPVLYAKSDTLDNAVRAGKIKGRVHE
ncbi:MAG: zinc dependent phospholipase C family protein [Bacteroidota bacterium]